MSKASDDLNDIMMGIKSKLEVLEAFKIELGEKLVDPCDIHITRDKEIYVDGILLGTVLRLETDYIDITSDFFHTRSIKIDYSKVKKYEQEEQKQMKRADLLDI